MSLIMNKTTSVIPIGGVATLTGNSGGAISPVVGNINILGAGVLSVAGAGNTLTISASATVATTYSTDSGNAVPAVNILQIVGGTNVTTSGAGNTVTINATADADYTVVSTSATPYVALSTDQVIAMDSTAGIKTVQLPNAPITGKWYTVKDSAGTAVANNITVTTVGGVVLIDGAASFIMNSAFESGTFVFTGTKYLVI